MNPQGYLSLVLHSHLPYVRHPEHEEFLEEDWLYEAITETYIPLIEIAQGWLRDGISARVTCSLTPTLISMLRDPLLQERYVRHLTRLIELSEQEIERTRTQPTFARLAQMYHDRFTTALELFEQYHGDLVVAFRELQDAGILEIITSGATHGYLPLMEVCRRESVRAQISVGVDVYREAFGRDPIGIWLPECGFYPGDDEILREFNLRYFLTDTHALLFGSPRPKYGVYAPAYCRSGMAAFARDQESSKSVWSAVEGYPGDPAYRDFYRDIGFDLDYEYVRPYIGAEGSREFTGIKYYRITGETSEKQPYDPERAADKAAEHAGNYMFNREKQVEYLSSIMDRPPLIVSPYDAELFGHWWYEGPHWLDMLVRKVAYDQHALELVTPGDYLERHPTNQVVTPSMSSWGYKGYHEVWLEGSNDWVYRHVHEATRRMVESSDRWNQADQWQQRVLNQMGRELLLAQSSDWAFIMKTGSHVEYAQHRVRAHIGRFTELYDGLQGAVLAPERLEAIESTAPLFPSLDYHLFCSKND